MPAIRKVPAKLSEEGRSSLAKSRSRRREERAREGKLKINIHDGPKVDCHKSKIEFRLNKAVARLEPFPIYVCMYVRIPLARYSLPRGSLLTLQL